MILEEQRGARKPMRLELEALQSKETFYLTARPDTRKLKLGDPMISKRINGDARDRHPFLSCRFIVQKARALSL